MDWSVYDWKKVKPGDAVVLEFLLYYMTKPERQLEVREAVYLDSMLNLF